MELNRLSVSILSVLITLAITCSATFYRLGGIHNEQKNLKELIVKLENKKANKDIVNLIREDIKGLRDDIKDFGKKLDTYIITKESKK